MKNAIGAKCAQNWAHQALGDNVIHKVKWQAINYIRAQWQSLPVLACQPTLLFTNNCCFTK